VCWQREADIEADNNGNWTWALPQSYASDDSYIFIGEERHGDYKIGEFRSVSDRSTVRVRVYNNDGSLREGNAVGDLFTVGLY